MAFLRARVELAYLNWPIPVVSDPEFDSFSSLVESDTLLSSDDSSRHFFRSIFRYFYDGECIIWWDGEERAIKCSLKISEFRADGIVDSHEKHSAVLSLRIPTMY